MAGFREHITVSAMLGIAYGGGMSVLGPLNFVQGALAGWLTAIGGMLPDLDSPTSRPVRELFGLVAGLLPLLIAGRLLRWLNIPAGPETVMLTIVIMYLAIRYGGSDMVKKLAKHRGMFHSIPAVLIAGQLVYLTYPSDLERTKLLMAAGIALGVLSHLVLDEIYSVDVSGGRLRLKKSSGTALKWSGEAFTPNVVTYCLLMLLSYVTLAQAGWIDATYTGGEPVAEQPADAPQWQAAAPSGPRR